MRACVHLQVFDRFLFTTHDTQFSTNVVHGTGSAVLSSENENDHRAAEHLLGVVVLADLRHFDVAAQRVSRWAEQRW